MKMCNADYKRPLCPDLLCEFFSTAQARGEKIQSETRATSGILGVLE